MDDAVRAVLAGLVQSEGDEFSGDLAAIESRLRERAGDHPEEVGALVTAAQAGAVDTLQGVQPGLYEITVGHLAGRMVRLYDADPEGARWALESWAQALGVGPYATALRAAPATAPSWPEPAPAVESRSAPAAAPAVESRPAPPLRRIPWPWVAVGAAGALGLIALVVLLRLIVGLVPSGGGGGAQPTTSVPVASPAPATTVAPNAGPLTVPPGLTLGSGDVQITLLWADGNDLDLHVVDPSGTEIYFSNPKSPTGGTLDHDDTAGCATTGTHVENVFWPTGAAPPGRYRVFVKNYSSCGNQSRYTLKATAKGQVAISSSGTVGALEGDQTPVSEFSIS